MYGQEQIFPDGTAIDPWFFDIKTPTLDMLGRRYVLTQYGILDDGRDHTATIQALIDRAAAEGGGVIVVPPGVYRSGALFFKQGVHLWVEEGGTLKGSDDISAYPLLSTRIEGESCMYFAALINADGVDGFVLGGRGTIDGSGQRAWSAFWRRRQWNPDCTNKDEQRARLVYLSNCRNVLFAGLRLQNSQFWTTHLYRCERVKYIGCGFYSPAAPLNAPSTDAIDIDVCTDVLIKNCHIEVNDDAIALKGGKGPWADTAPENGPNERVLIEDCTFGFCHACLTCGSESVADRNILLRRAKVSGARNFLRLKLRPDTHQLYEYITVEQVTGNVDSFININPWAQFYDLKGRGDLPRSEARHITVRGCELDCGTCFNMAADEERYILSDFTFEDLNIRAQKRGEAEKCVSALRMENCSVARI